MLKFLYLEKKLILDHFWLLVTRVRVPLPRESKKKFSLKNNFSLSRLVKLVKTSRMVVLLAYLVMVALIGRSQRALPRAATDFEFLYLEEFSKKVDHHQIA